MTQPVLAGYPDYQTQSLQSSIVIKDISGITPSPTIYGPFYCGAMPYITVNAQVPAVRCAITIGWFSDAAGSIVVGDDTLEVAPGQDGRITIPVIAPYLTITISFAGAMTALVTGNVVMSASPSHQTTGFSGVLFNAFNVAIGAGAVVTLNAPRVRTGPAVVGAAMGTNVGFVEFYAVNTGGVANYLAEIALSADRRPLLIHIPSVPLRVIIRNTGAASLYNLGVTMLAP